MRRRLHVKLGNTETVPNPESPENIISLCTHVSPE
jgi:hypothetical protein